MLSAFGHFGPVSVMGFVTEPWHSRHVLFFMWLCGFECARAVALSSACLVSCWSMVFGSRHSCLEFRFRVEVWTLALHVQFHFPAFPVLSSRVLCFMLLHAVRVLSVACIHVMYCAVCLCFSWAACSHVVMSCVNTWLMSILISCISSCPILHMACDFVLLAMCFFLCVSTWHLSECSHVNCLGLALPCPALPCPALPCLALSCFSSTG